MTCRITTLAAAFIIAGSPRALAQSAPAPRAVADSLKGVADIARSFVIRTAEQVPEATRLGVLSFNTAHNMEHTTATWAPTCA